MASILDSIFGSKVKVPDAVTVDAAAEAKKAASYNQDQLTAFKDYASDSSEFMKNLFSQLSPNLQSALDTNYSVGTQLATTGTTKAATGALDYYRRLGLETAAATGAPVSSQFSQNLGGSLGIMQILQNQIQGTNILAQNASQQQSVTGQYLNPAMATFSSSLTNPATFISAAVGNANTTNQMNLAKAQADAAADPFGNYMANLFSTVVGSLAGAAGTYLTGGATAKPKVSTAPTSTLASEYAY